MNSLGDLLVRRRSFAGLLILGLVGLVYANSLDNGFQYDDRHAILENPHLRDLREVPSFFVRPECFSRDPDKAMYRPLLLLSLALNYAWSGYQTWSYHLVNLGLHGVCALLVWGILWRGGSTPAIALGAGLFFAAHPLATEPVNYLSSRSELLAGVGVLGGFWLYLLAGSQPRWGLILASSTLFAAGLLAKEGAIVLPALLVAWEWSCGKWAGRRWTHYLPYAAVAGVYLAYQTLGSGFLTRAIATQPVRSLELQLGTQAKALAFYLKLFSMPVGLSVDHPFEVSPLGSIVPLLCLLVALLLLWWGWQGRREHPWIFWGMLWAGIALLPTALVPLNVLVNEHRLYLPLAGLSFSLSEIAALSSRVAGRRWLGVFLIGLLAMLSAQRNAFWKDEFTLWSDAMRKGPGSIRPYVYLGNYARQKGEPAEALNYYRKALALDPDHLLVRSNMANAYRDLGQLDQAIALYRQILEEHPGLAEVHYNLGVAYYEVGDLTQAREQYLAVPPDNLHYPLALNNLGAVHEREGRLDSALVYYRLALERQPGYREADDNLNRLQRRWVGQIEALFEAGECVQVEALCRQLLAIIPTHRKARFFLAASLFGQRRYAESLVENQRLVDQYPDDEEGRLQLANLLETLGRLSEALQVYEELRQRTHSEGMRRLVEQRRQRLLEQGR